MIEMLDEDARILADLKKDLEEKIMRMEKELSSLKVLLKLVDETLSKISFIPASKLMEEEEPQQETYEFEQTFPIKSKTGEDLGTIYVGKGILKIVPKQDLSLKIPPFQSFFIERVLEEMKKKDEIAVEQKKKSPEEILEYEIKSEGDIIKEVIIRNVSEESRIREIRSSIRWTLERMMEKMSR
ncbi:MAG: hypothetical protein NZ922_02835 [Candidatus Methanomethyliaceae archaeon]|nr:hypothetical protein [Candidatus Methanomethyliaceae archaeon]MDW7970966.1 hypothetical protein [Nitrososphaerota archaeon]